MKNFKPILFSTEMVQAILEDRKTQTRRIVKDKLLQENENEYNEEDFLLLTMEKPVTAGMILWVRETWQYSDDLENPYLYKQKELDELQPEYFKRMKWKPSIFMPKEACRIFLEVTNVRVERLNQISRKDRACEGLTENSGLHDWKKLWIDVHGPVKGYGTWKANSWVWVYDFKKVVKPENFLL